MMKTAAKWVQAGVNFWTKFCVVFCLVFTSISAQAIEVGDTLIIEEVTTIDGHVITAQELKGKYVIVEVWATWCPFCHRQNQNLV